MAKPWHWIIKDDKSKLLDLITYFSTEIDEAKKEVKKVGSVEKLAQDLPGWHETRLSQLQELGYRDWETDRKSTRLNSSHLKLSRMPSSA